MDGSLETAPLRLAAVSIGEARHAFSKQNARSRDWTMFCYAAFAGALANALVAIFVGEAGRWIDAIIAWIASAVLVALPIYRVRFEGPQGLFKISRRLDGSALSVRENGLELHGADFRVTLPWSALVSFIEVERSFLITSTTKSVYYFAFGTAGSDDARTLRAHLESALPNA